MSDMLWVIMTYEQGCDIKYWDNAYAILKLVTLSVKAYETTINTYVIVSQHSI